jgi:hypothetical protein
MANCPVCNVFAMEIDVTAAETIIMPFEGSGARGATGY